MRVVFVDANQRGFLGAAWAAGAQIGRFDRVFRVHGVPELVTALAREVPAGAEVQIFHHGLPAEPRIGKEVLKPSPVWAKIGCLWMRSCSVFQGHEGMACARAWARHCDVVAHTRVIGTWGLQSGLVGLRRGEEPWWSPDDKGHSYPGAPRTILATRMTVPAWAWGP